MMAWYVFALVDRPPAERQGRGLAGALAARAVPGGFAMVERRADVPPVELGALKQHDVVIARLAGAVPSILPVRFGTLLEMEEIEEALQDREDEIAEAFAAVRGRVQFTWRRRGSELRSPRAAARPSSGKAYLQHAARAAKSALPAFRAVREKLRPLIAAERYQTATSSLPESLY